MISISNQFAFVLPTRQSSSVTRWDHDVVVNHNLATVSNRVLQSVEESKSKDVGGFKSLHVEVVYPEYGF